MTNDELAELVRRIAGEDRNAFDRLYRELETPLYRFILSRLNDPFRAADVLHDVFLDVWRGAGGFLGTASVKTWLFAIAYRKVMDVYRKDGRLVGEDEIAERVSDEPDAVTCLIASEEREMLAHCLGTLKPAHRSAIELAFIEDMSYREVAEVVGVPEGTIKTRVFHAKSLLLRCLAARMSSRTRT